MRLGIVLPTFHGDPGLVTGMARAAEDGGLDGVFVFDHLWHIGRRARPALHGPTLVGALAAVTSRVMVGTLVARIGILRDEVLAAMLDTSDRIAPGRVIAGLGIGDALSRGENEAYGIAFPPRPERLNQLVGCARLIRSAGVPLWVGGLTPAMWQVGAAEGDAVNVWDTPVAMVTEAARHAQPAEVTWAGLARRGTAEKQLARHVAELERAGAVWAIYAPVAGDQDLVGRLGRVRRGMG